MEPLETFEQFLWDEKIVHKLWTKHRISPFEVEEVYMKPVLGPAPDIRHSAKDKRYAVVGLTDQQRYLRVVYVEAGKSIKVIHAREASKELIEKYEEAVEESEKEQPG